MGIVTLLTDFGTQDGYVAAVKGAMLSISPELCIVDISHAVLPQDVPAAAFALANCWHTFPKGTVHVVVVDPGVGTHRRSLVIEAQGQLFVAPDNGVLTHVIRHCQTWRAYHLIEQRYWRHPVSHTFHGRDIFGPVGAHLAAGLSPELLGPAVTDINLLELGTFVHGCDMIKAHVQHIDRFGNIISDVPADELQAVAAWTASAGDLHQVESYETYGRVPADIPVALVGSHGFVEIGVNKGNAAQRACVHVGMPFTVHLSD